MSLDLEKLLEICKNRIIRGQTIEQVKDFILANHDEEVWEKILNIGWYFVILVLG